MFTIETNKQEFNSNAWILEGVEAMHKYRIILLLCFTLLVGILEPQKVSAAGIKLVISGNIVNIRAGPGESYEVIDKASKGEAFTVLKEAEGWYLVNLEGDRHGWIAGWLSVATTEKEEDEESPSALEENTGVDSPLREENRGSTLEEKDASELDGAMEPSAEESKGSNANVDSLEEDSQMSKLQQKENSPEMNKRKKQPEEQETIAEKDKQYPEKSEKPVGEKQVRIITTAALKVREIGSLHGKVIGTVKEGESFPILEEKNDWLKIEFKPGRYGWVAGWFVDKSQRETKQQRDKDQDAAKKNKQDSTATIVYNGTNIREEPDTGSTVVKRANVGDTFPIVEMKGDWYGILLKNGDKAYVAGWLVTVSGRAPQIKKQDTDGSLHDKLIIIDPGHGGKDDGATGIGGSKEKELTLKTAQILYDKLHAKGAKVILTRNSDEFVSLNSRVRLSHILEADAYISIHFDSIADSEVRGITSYYYHQYQKSLASHVHGALKGQTKMKDRGIRFGDYHVIRENKQNAVLLELGYLSNPTEENLISSRQYHEQVSDAIVQGLTNYFAR